MFTLVYLNGRFNRPETLNLFLESNIGGSPLLQVDCITPYHGTTKELIHDVCEYLSHISPEIEVIFDMIRNSSTESHDDKWLVHFLVIQITVKAIS